LQRFEEKWVAPPAKGWLFDRCERWLRYRESQSDTIVTVPRVFFTTKLGDVFDPEALQVIPRPTVVALYKLPSVVLPAADAEKLFSITVGKWLHMQPSSCGDRTDGLLGEQGCTGVCGVTWYENLLQTGAFSI